MVAMRLIMAGVFDAFPKLQIILGHYAEGLPFMLDRVDRPFIQGHVRPDPAVAPVLKRMPSEYLRDNFLASTSGNYSAEAFACTKAAMGAGRMVIGSDYPFEDMKVCTDFLEAQPMSDAEKEQLYWRTARVGWPWDVDPVRARRRPEASGGTPRLGDRSGARAPTPSV